MLKLHVFRFSDVVHCVLVACGVEKREIKRGHNTCMYVCLGWTTLSLCDPVFK